MRARSEYQRRHLCVAWLAALFLAAASGVRAQPGKVDVTFAPVSGISGGLLSAIYSVAVHTNSKVLVGGNFSSFNSAPRNNLARLNSDGTLDAAFNPTSGANGEIEVVLVQGDAKILLAGKFSAVNGVGRNHIARLNGDGSLDTGFDPGAGANSTVWSLAVQADGKVLMGGDFSIVNGTNRSRIARLNADGSLDTSFNPGTGADDTVYSVLWQSTGKVLMGGNFLNINGTPRSHIARLTSSGAVDATFTPGAGANDYVFTMISQPDLRVFIAGNFTSFNGAPRACIARLNTNGDLDATFDPASGCNLQVESLALQADGRLVMAGDFDQFDGTARNHIARLNSDGTVKLLTDPDVIHTQRFYRLRAQ